LKDKMEKVVARVDGDPEFTEDVTRLFEKGDAHERGDNLSVLVADTTRSVFSLQREEEEES